MQDLLNNLVAHVVGDWLQKIDLIVFHLAFESVVEKLSL